MEYSAKSNDEIMGKLSSCFNILALTMLWLVPSSASGLGSVNINAVGQIISFNEIMSTSSCVATLIDKNTVLTNYHCLVDENLNKYNYNIFIAGNNEARLVVLKNNELNIDSKRPASLSEIGMDVGFLSIKGSPLNIEPIKINRINNPGANSFYMISPEQAPVQCNIDFFDKNLILSSNCVFPKGYSGSPLISSLEEGSVIGIYSGWIEGTESKSMGMGSISGAWKGIK